MNILDGKITDPSIAAERCIRWFHGPIERIAREKSGIINTVTLTTPEGFVVISWSAASRQTIVSRLQTAIHVASQGDRKEMDDTATFEMSYQEKSGLILPV